MEPETLMEASRKIGKQVAEKFFTGPNDRIHDSIEPGGAAESRTHLLKFELAAMIALGAELAFKAAARSDSRVRARDSYERSTPKGLFSIRDLEDQIGLSKRAVERLVAAGEIKSVRIGRRRFVDPRDLATYIDLLRSQSDNAVVEQKLKQGVR